MKICKVKKEKLNSSEFNQVWLKFLKSKRVFKFEYIGSKDLVGLLIEDMRYAPEHFIPTVFDNKKFITMRIDDFFKCFIVLKEVGLKIE